MARCRSHTQEFPHHLDEPLRVGLFASAKKYDAVVRFSNGGPTALADKKPDVRGLAVKLIGVGGKKIIPGMQDCVTQDFLAILSQSVPFPSAEAFVWFVLAARSPLTLVPKAFMKFGIGKTISILKTLQASLGAPLLAARFPRAYLDVNREPYELDPELFAGPLPDYANPSTMRVIGGLGTIARIVADSEEIYREKPSLGMAFERIELLYKPFHAALAGLIERTCRQFGYAVLVDCHSMPSTSTGTAQGPRPDFVIGDRFGGACDARVMRSLRDALAQRGAQVQLNRPYAGGFITEHYGRPYRGVHAIQLEINRGLYLDEATLAPSAGFDGLKLGLTHALGRMISEVRCAMERRAAAE